jgi:Kef-type K+ transport system membrane component KefB
LIQDKAGSPHFPQNPQRYRVAGDGICLLIPRGLLRIPLAIPVFFIGTGFYIDPPSFVESIVDHFPGVVGIIAALLVGKWIAAQVAGRLFGYSSAARMTMWSLTLPQVAATLAATLVAYHTRNPAGERLLDDRMLNVVLVLMLTTSILGPLLTQRFAPRLVEEQSR